MLRFPILLRVLAVAALASGIGACSTDLSLSNVTLNPKPDSTRKPDWATFSGGRSDFQLRPITAADLVGPEGQCGGGAPGQASGFADSQTGGGAPPATGGIALQMTECDVVKRAGQVEKIDFGADDAGQRSVVMTYLQGPWPGIYRFTAGRLVSIERAPAPPPAPAPAKKAAPKKPAGT
jgi:hypothetical protein